MAIFLVPFVPPGGSGANGQVVYNSGGVFASESDLIYDPATNLLTLAGDIRLNDGGSFTTTIQAAAPSANRTIVFPDASGSVALVSGGGGQIIYNNAGVYSGVGTLTFDGTNLTLAGRLINTYTSLASSPAKLFSGSWFTGGTSTTTKPHVLVEASGATSTGWNTAGTGFGVNAASGFTGSLVELETNGVTRFSVSGTGTATFSAAASTAPAVFSINAVEFYRINNEGIQCYNQAAPAAVNATGTLTIANLKTGIITSTSAAATDMTLPSGTLTEAGLSGVYTNMSFEWSVINTGPSLVRVLSPGADHTIVGSGNVATATSGRFATRRTAANTFVTYRLT